MTDVPTIAPTLATMIGLGVGIDYALFIVTRHKLQLRGGMAMRESVARATATAGGAVLFAGGTVVIALCSLLVAGIPLVTTLGYTAAIAVVVSVLGRRHAAARAARRPRAADRRRPRPLGRSHPDDHQPHGWARWARGVAARPWRSLVASTAVLARPRVAGAATPPRAVEHRRAAGVDHRAPGLRRHERRASARAATARCW